MLRVALYTCVFIVTLLADARVFAHGEPPVAYAVLSHDAEGPLAVSLSAGVALRRSPQRYRFVCPGAWQDQFPAPLAALPDGTLVVGATGGLMLLDAAGTLRAHPDPAAIGRSTDLVRSPHGVFALRAAQSGSEVLAVAAQTVRVLWHDTTSWSAIAALDDRIVLMRAANRLLELVAISAIDGSELERQSTLVDLPVDYVFARASAGLPYALLVFRDGSMALGAVGAAAFTKLTDGLLSIAGPLRVADATLLARDGQLVQLTAAGLSPLADAHEVQCLAEHTGLRYACEREGITEVSGQVLGKPLFRFTWLEAPALEQVAEGEPRMLCNAQWQDFLLDMQLAMPETIGAVPTEVIAGAGGAQPLAAAAGASGGAAQTVHERGTGCVVHPSRDGQQSALFCSLALWLLIRRRCSRCENK